MKILMTVWAFMKPMASGLAFGLVGGLLALLVSRLAFPPPTFIALDLAGVVGEQVQSLLVRQDLDDAGKARASAVFAQQLDVQSRALAADYRAIVLAAPAVVSGVPDFTPELRRRVAVAMASQGISAVAMPPPKPMPAPTVQSGIPPVQGNPVPGVTPSGAFWETPAVGNGGIPQGGQP